MATREKIYPPRSEVMWSAKKNKWRDDPGGKGREIAREARVCARCAEQGS